MVQSTERHAGWYQQPYGDFSGKEQSATPTPPITQPHAGWFQQRYGDFSGREQAAGVTTRRRAILTLRDPGRLAPGL